MRLPYLIARMSGGRVAEILRQIAVDEDGARWPRVREVYAQAEASWQAEQRPGVEVALLTVQRIG